MSNPSLQQAGFTQLPASLAPPVAEQETVVETQENSPQTISDIMARMFEIRTARKELSDKDSEFVQEWEALEATLLGKLQEQGSTRVSSKLGTASISAQELPIVEDWDAVWSYIKENDAFHLMQKRPAVGAYRELLMQALKEAGVEDLEAALKDGVELPVVVPGTRPIIKKSINLRAGN